MLDSLKPLVRHLAIIIFTSVLSAVALWLQTSQTEILSGVPPLYVPLAASGLTALSLYFTTLTRQYGVGSQNASVLNTGAAPVVNIDDQADVKLTDEELGAQAENYTLSRGHELNEPVDEPVYGLMKPNLTVVHDEDPTPPTAA